jgi:hypothetical protein
VRKRFVTVTLLGALLIPATLVAAPAASAHHDTGPCDFHRIADETIHHFSKRQIRCASERFGPIPGGRRRAVCIATRESGLDPEASSATGLYLGLFQHAAAYWDHRYDTWTRPVWGLPDSALEGRTNAIVTIRMVRDLGGWRAAGWRVHGC